MIDRAAYYYEHEYSNVHRAAHTLAARSTDAYESAREKVQRFLGAASPSEIVFVRGTTEGVNLVANSWGRSIVGAGDEIVAHHAGASRQHRSVAVLSPSKWARVMRVVPVTDRGEVMLDDYRKAAQPAHAVRRRSPTSPTRSERCCRCAR